VEEKTFLGVVVVVISTAMVKAMTVKTVAAAVPRVAETLRRPMTAATRTVTELKP